MTHFASLDMIRPLNWTQHAPNKDKAYGILEVQQWRQVNFFMGFHVEYAEMERNTRNEV
jgi:hypothetical protein